MGCFEGKATVELYTTGNTRLSSTDVTIVSGTPTPTPTATPSNRPPKFKSGSSQVTNSENYTGVWETYTTEDPDKSDTVTLTLKTGGDNDRFSIDASGALKFKSPPDYEKPQDVGKNNVYNITVVATDDGSPKKSVEKTVKVTVTDVNEPPTIGGSTYVPYEENGTTTVATYSATDPEKGKITWELKSGGDKSRFSIDASGALEFKSPPDYEKPQDVGKVNIYSITVKATDDGSPKKSAEKAVTVRVTDVNEPPVFSDGASTVRAVVENTSGNTAFDSPVGATDQDGDSLTYSISGTDASSFSIDATNGQLKTNAKLNYEAKSSYSAVQVDVTDNRGGSANIAVTVNVTDVNEPPTIGGSTDVSYKENGTTTVATYSATDPEKGKITWTLKSGGDKSRFSIDASGALSFASSPDYERPQDVGKNNVYNITVKATDDGSPKKSAEKAVEVTVTDVNEPPGKPVAPTVTSGGQSSLNVSWSAPSNTGPPITGYGVKYRKGSSGTFKGTSHSGTATTATISGLDAGTGYEVQVRASNAEGTGAWSNSGIGSTTATPTPTPSAWLEPDPATVVFRADGTEWHRFTVKASGPVNVQVNPELVNTRLEISTSEQTTDRCPPSLGQQALRRHNEHVWLAACQEGTAYVKLKNSSGTVLKSYKLDVLAPTPAPPVCEKGRESMVVLSDRDRLGFDNRWVTGCVYFVLRALSFPAHIRVSLESTGVDPVLTVYKGEGVSGTATHANDDTLEGSGTGSFLGATIGRGTYTLKAEAKSSPPSDSRFRLDIVVETAVLGDMIDAGKTGHQGDYSVEYEVPPIGWLPWSWTNTLVGDEIAKWNRASNLVSFCPVGSCSGAQDGNVMRTTVRVGDKRSHDAPTVDGWMDTSTGKRIIDCGRTIACLAQRRIAQNQHMTYVELRIENPAWQHDSGGADTQVEWVNDRNKHNDIKDGKLQRYLPSTVLHELGHALGLDDLRGPGQSRYKGYLMYKAYDHLDLTPGDSTYLKQVYRNHMSEIHRSP